jgi:hypothetical protein
MIVLCKIEVLDLEAEQRNHHVQTDSNFKNNILWTIHLSATSSAFSEIGRF